MRNTLPFDLREFKEDYCKVVNRQNEFTKLVVEALLNKHHFDCDMAWEVSHPSGVGSCFRFTLNMDVCGLHTQLYLDTDNTTGSGELLALHLTCKDMFIENQLITIPAKKHLTILWSDEKRLRPIIQVIVES